MTVCHPSIRRHRRYRRHEDDYTTSRPVSVLCKARRRFRGTSLGGTRNLSRKSLPRGRRSLLGPSSDSMNHCARVRAPAVTTVR